MSIYHSDIKATTPSALQEAATSINTLSTQHRNIIDYMHNGYAYCRMIVEDGSPVDFIHEEVNLGYEMLTGLSNVIGKRITEVIPGMAESNPDFIDKHRRVAESGVPDKFEFYFKSLSKWFDISIYSPKQGYFVSIFDDITERKRVEDKLHRSSRALQAINDCNHALLHSDNEIDLLQNICNIIVDSGGYRMAWIGYSEHDEIKSVYPVAQAGFVQGYLDMSMISWADVPRGQGPTGTAIRMGKPAYSINIKEDPKIEPWRHEALRRGYASIQSLPLRVDNIVIGALTVYSDCIYTYNAKESDLLASLADNLSYGITMLRTRKAKDDSVASLKLSEERFRKLFENHSAIMLLVDPENGNIINANHSAANFYGWSISELRKMSIHQINNVITEIATFPQMEKVSSSEQNNIFRHKRADGSIRDVEVFGNKIIIDGKEILYSIIHDITERKRYESFTAFRLRLLQMAESNSVEELLMAILDKADGEIAMHKQFEAFPGVLFLINHEGKILAGNHSFVEQICNNSENVIGSNIFNILTPELAVDRKRKIDEVLFTGERLTFDDEQNGSILRYTIYPIPNKEGAITKLLICNVDVTTLNLTATEEFDQRVHYRQLFNNLEKGFAYCRIIFDHGVPVDFVHEVVNINFNKLTGLKYVEGKKFSEIIPEINKTNPDFIERLGRVALTGIAEQFEFYFSNLNKWFEITAYSHQKGYFVLVLAPMISLKTGNWEWNLDTDTMTWNDELQMLYGLNHHSNILSYELWQNSIMPSDKSQTEKVIKEAVAKGNQFNVIYNISDSNGAIRRLMTQGFAVKNDAGKVKQYTGITIDISEYKNTKTSHLINTTNLNNLINSSYEAVCSLGIDGRIIEANANFSNIFPIEAINLNGYDIHMLFSEQLYEERKYKLEHLFETGEPVHFKDKNRTIDADNNDIDNFYHISAYPVYGEYDKIVCLAIFITSSNEHNEAEKARRQFDKQYQTLIAASPDSIITTNLDGIISSVSDIGLEIFGANNKADVIGKPFSTIVYPADIKIIDEIFDVTFREGLIQNKEILLKKKNNTLYSAEISAALIQDYNGAPSSYMMIIRDISQRKIIESELFHAKRLISLGEMASGIAHEIYQPINNIGLIVDKILLESTTNKWSCEKELKIKSEKIFENIIRVQTIIDNIRSFSSTDNNYISSVVNINKGIRNALLMFSEQCKHKSIMLDFTPEQERISVTGNIYKFEQVISNLIKNSIDAIEEKKFAIGSSFEMKIKIRSFYTEETATVTIEDNGIGINEKNIEYIMHPFFTTKDSGKGTGLGLSISYGIIKEMNGDIRIKSNPLYGTKVVITLPKMEKGKQVILQ
jgi:PAS domain S-box-containing protein